MKGTIGIFLSAALCFTICALPVGAALMNRAEEQSEEEMQTLSKASFSESVAVLQNEAAGNLLCTEFSDLLNECETTVESVAGNTIERYILSQEEALKFRDFLVDYQSGLDISTYCGRTMMSYTSTAGFHTVITLSDSAIIDKVIYDAENNLLYYYDALTDTLTIDSVDISGGNTFTDQEMEKIDAAFSSPGNTFEQLEAIPGVSVSYFEDGTAWIQKESYVEE